MVTAALETITLQDCYSDIIYIDQARLFHLISLLFFFVDKPSTFSLYVIASLSHLPACCCYVAIVITIIINISIIEDVRSLSFKRIRHTAVAAKRSVLLKMSRIVSEP